VKTAYFECFSGISGNMVIGALLDAGLDFKVLETEINKLGLHGFELKKEEVKKHSIAGTYFEVLIKENKTNHHRKLSDVKRIIDESTLNQHVKNLSLKIFQTLAIAESKAHDIPIEDVYFHETGAIDSIIDIVGVSLGINELGIQEINSSPIPLGKGFINCKHGKMPNPSPGALYCLEGVDTYGVDTDVEIVTPTGAAIISTLANSFGPAPQMKIENIGYGAGKFDLDRPNLLRISIGESIQTGQLCDKIEVNIDDMNPEMYENVFEKLFSVGALDVFTINIQMKKNRPAIILCALCFPEVTQKLVEIIYEETTSTGLRIYKGLKYSLDKEIKTVSTIYGDIRVKLAYLDGQVINVKPEHSDCKKLANRAGVSLKKIYNEVLPEIQKLQP